MANLKISQLNDGGVAQTSDLIRIARPTGGGYLDWSTSMDDVSDYVDTAIDPVHRFEVGAAGGVPPLNGSGVIPTQYVPAMATDYLGVWNATTNSPTLSDGTGSVGEFLFVGTAGTQDLGSGSVSYAVYNIVIHNGTIWEKVPVNASGVASWNTLTGAVDVTTLDLPDDVDTRYVTDNYLAACAGTSGTPSNTNRYVTDNDPRLQVSGGIINNITYNFSGGYNMVTAYGDGVNEVGNSNTSRRLNTLGYNSTTAAAMWPFTASKWGGIDVTITEYDEVCLQEALATMENSRFTILYAGASIFLINRGGIELPSIRQLGVPGTFPSVYDDPMQFIFDGQGANFHVKSISWESANGVFTSPTITGATQETALAYHLVLRNLKISGNGYTGTALRIRCTKKLIMDNIFIDDFNRGIEMRFCLKSMLTNCSVNNCANEHYYVNSADWTTVPLGDACADTTNQIAFYNCDFYSSDETTGIGFYVRRSDCTTINDCVFEGYFKNAVVWDQASCSVSKQFSVNNIHLEIKTDFPTDGVFKIKGQNTYDVTISNIYVQCPSNPGNTGILVNTYDTSGFLALHLTNIQYNTNENRYKLRNVGSGLRLTLTNVKLQGDPQTAADVVNTGAFPLIWEAGSTMPTSVRITPLLT